MVTRDARQTRPLGRILVQREVITEQQLEHALADQRRTGARLGDILAERGWASPLSIATALARQRSIEGRSRSSPPAEARGDSWKPLGVLLVEKGLISEVQLQQALADQWEHRGFLGESGENSRGRQGGRCDLPTHGPWPDGAYVDACPHSSPTTMISSAA